MKATICLSLRETHLPGIPFVVAQPSVYAHLAHGDAMGACPGWVSGSYVESLPTCAAIDASGASLVSGIRLPGSAAGDGFSMNEYFCPYPEWRGE